MGGQRDIWTAGVDGKGALAVTDDAATDYNPVWSPDGKRLYFLSDRTGVMSLWRIPIDEKSGRTLGSAEPVFGGAAQIRDLAVAGDGRMVFAQARTEWSSIMLRLDPGTGRLDGEGQLLLRSSRPQGEADLSPDGRYLVTSSFSGAEDIFLMAPDGTGRTALTDDPARDRRPVFHRMASASPSTPIAAGSIRSG